MWQIFVLWGMSQLVTGRCQCESGNSEVYAEEGSQATLPCVCRPTSLTAAVIHWTRGQKGTLWRKSRNGLEYRGAGGRRVRVPHSQVGVGEYSMYIHGVRTEDGGKYTCMVQDGEKHIFNKVTLRVIKVSVSPPEPVEHSKIKLACSVHPWPAGATVSWEHNEKTVNPKSSAYAFSTARVGVLEGKASESMMGNWSCVISSHGMKQGNAATALTVRGIVNPSSDSVKVYAEVGSAVTLPCVFSNGLTPSHPVWERLDAGGSILPLPPSLNRSSLPSFPFLPPWDVSVQMGEVGQVDGGRYRCSATVEGYSLAREMQLVTAHVLINEPSTQKATVTLTCHLSDTSEVTDWDWVLVNANPNNTQSVSSIQKGRVLRINRVTDRNADQWVCRFHGKQGVLGNVTYHPSQMSGLRGETEPEASSKTVLVFSLGFLLVALLVLGQMYRNHRRRKMILQYPAMETIVHTTANEREERERSRVKEDKTFK
ncbi:hypothetical protein DPEC_G00143960 [Dallia pectoralis]|uniref:Uncharacterized protein n=1 Tax=Dallia pectoralis TaxID=75939 RepID=A0ACC2GP11_DALPE|nr:hypothetical protein DPEC_G00143960 [Dallia pectoralis]